MGGEEVPQYAEVVVIKSENNKNSSTTRVRRTQNPPVYAEIVHQKPTSRKPAKTSKGRVNKMW